MEFYVTLPSNVNSHPDNRIHSYITTLPTTLSLDSTWRVALSEIHYTNSWYNLKRTNSATLIDMQGNKVGPSMTIPPGRYTSIEALIREISQRSVKPPGVDRMPRLSYDESSQKLRVKFGKLNDREKSNIMFKFSKELNEMLGLVDGYDMRNSEVYMYVTANSPPEPQHQVAADPLAPHAEALADYWVATPWIEGKQAYELSGGINSLYIYSDVVDYRIVGDVRAQLLRTVSVPPRSKFGDAVHVMFEKPYYLPLATKEIHSIEINVKDDSGCPIDFRFGRVEVTLHFIKTDG